MRENNMDENELLSFLERLGIYGKLKKNHPLIEASGPSLLSLFEKQRYLTKVTSK